MTNYLNTRFFVLYVSMSEYLQHIIPQFYINLYCKSIYVIRKMGNQNTCLNLFHYIFNIN